MVRKSPAFIKTSFYRSTRVLDHLMKSKLFNENNHLKRKKKKKYLHVLYKFIANFHKIGP